MRGLSYRRNGSVEIQASEGWLRTLGPKPKQNQQRIKPPSFKPFPDATMFKDQLVDIAGRAKQSHTPERRFALFSKKRLLPPLNSTVLRHGRPGPCFRCVLALVTGDEVHRWSSVARITQDRARNLPANDASGRLLRRTVPDQITTVFRSWLGTCPCQCRSVHSTRYPNDAQPPYLPGEQWPVALGVPTSARGRNVARSSRPRRLAAVR